MSDREILEKYINLDNTCLTEEERKEVMDMLYKYKEAFSLWDEIGTDWSHLSHTAVKSDSCLTQIFCQNHFFLFPCII